MFVGCYTLLVFSQGKRILSLFIFPCKVIVQTMVSRSHPFCTQGVPAWNPDTDNLATALDIMGFTIGDFATWVGVHRNTVSMWVHHGMPPRVKHLLKWRLDILRAIYAPATHN